MKKIKLPENTGKLLVYCDSESIVAWQLGYYNIYLDKFETLFTKTDDIQVQLDQPSIARIKYFNPQDIYAFIKAPEPSLRAVRLFKTVRYNDKDGIPMGFYMNTMKNLLGLMKEKTIRIDSNNRQIRNKMYQTALSLNEENKFKCTFDFDKYDVAFIAKEFKDFFEDEKVLVTYLYSPEHPNKTISKEELKKFK